MSDADLLRRRAERTADRLRVVGPRMAARSSPEAAAVLDAVHATAQRLADLAARADGHGRRAVPRLAPHALGDQLLVLAQDVAATTDPAAMAGALAALLDLGERL